MGAAIVSALNVFTSFMVIPVLKRFGRKTLMVFFSFLMAISLIALCFAYNAFTEDDSNDTAKSLSVVLVLLYVFLFQLSFGPVVWLNMAEIMTDKGMSLGVIVNWTFTIIMGLITPFLLSGWLFLSFGIFCVIAGIFCIVFMKETKGLSETEVACLYSREKNS